MLPPLRFTDRWQDRWRARLEAIEQPFPFAWHTIPPETWQRWTTDIAAIEVPTLAVSAWHDSYPGETVDYHARLTVPKRLLLGPWKHEAAGCGDSRSDRVFRGLRRRGSGDGSGTTQLSCVAGRRRRVQPPASIPTLRRSRSSGDAFRSGLADGGWRAATRHIIGSDAVRPRGWRAGGDRRCRAADGDAVSRGLDRRPRRPAVGLDDAHGTDATRTSRPTTTARSRGPRSLPHSRCRSRAFRPSSSRFDPDRPDVPLRAWLSDVRSDGSSTLISQGWVRPTHVIGAALPADHAVQVRVPLSPTSYRLPAGHTGSAWPSPARTSPRSCRRRTGQPSTLRPGRTARVWSCRRSPWKPTPDRRRSGRRRSPAPWPRRARGAGGHHAVERSIDDAEGRYRPMRVVRTRLENGAELRWDLESSAVGGARRPGR